MIYQRVCVVAVIVAAGFSISCSAPLQPRVNVEDVERQAPVTPRPNAFGNAAAGANAVDYSNDRLPRNRGFGGYGGVVPRF